MEEIKEQQKQCECCQKWFFEYEISFGPDPFASEIYDDQTDVWLCDECYGKHSDDI